MSDGPPPTSDKPRRRFGPLFWMGSAMWVLVGVVAANFYFGQIGRAPRQAAPESGGAAADRAFTLRSDGTGEIDIGQLMSGHGSQTPGGSIWDPEGLEDFSFRNCDGRTITKQDLLGKPWAVATVFTHCLGPCPAVTRAMRELQDALAGYDCRLVTLTVDPGRDTPAVLKKYAELHGADLNKWYFLTGNVDEIYGLIHRGFKLPVQEATGDVEPGYEVIHSIYVLLVDEHGVVQGKYSAGKPDEMANLRRELQKRSAKIDDKAVEAASGELPAASKEL
ncbi:MAG: SCO family protein [Planctomycetaceae bacterium]|nr:SCO family protein [Planctomycetaceae bacterium]